MQSTFVIFILFKPSDLLIRQDALALLESMLPVLRAATWQRRPGTSEKKGCRSLFRFGRIPNGPTGLTCLDVTL